MSRLKKCSECGEWLDPGWGDEIYYDGDIDFPLCESCYNEIQKEKEIEEALGGRNLTNITDEQCVDYLLNYAEENLKEEFIEWFWSEFLEDEEKTKMIKCFFNTKVEFPTAPYPDLVKDFLWDEYENIKEDMYEVIFK